MNVGLQEEVGEPGRWARKASIMHPPGKRIGRTVGWAFLLVPQAGQFSKEASRADSLKPLESSCALELGSTNKLDPPSRKIWKSLGPFSRVTLVKWEGGSQPVQKGSTGWEALG